MSFYAFNRGILRKGKKATPHLGTKGVGFLPIRTIDFSDPSDKFRHDRMVKLVSRMLDLHKQLSEAQMESERRPIEEEITVTDREIDELVYDLYDLTRREIKIVEESTGNK